LSIPKSVKTEFKGSGDQETKNSPFLLNPGTHKPNNSIAPFWEMSMIETEAIEGTPPTDAEEGVYAEVGVYGQENGFQSFKPAFVSRAGEDALDRAWGRRMGINLGYPLSEWGSPDHVFKTPGRIASA
jgi:hypothetical protein